MKVSIIFCTYKREQNVLFNLDILNKYCKSYIYHVYVIDNASSLPNSLNNDFITVVYNNNLGGSGGYARGMYEAKKDKNCTHILLMDDDIQFDPVILKNAIHRLSTINPNDWLAFGMRTFEKPNILYEDTAWWSGVKAYANHRGRKLSSAKAFKHKKCNYAAWWSLIMPISVVNKYGYPMPYFIKSDDVEYGLRKQDEKIVCYPDISILHEDFDKKYNPYIEYYNTRNYLITNSIHLKHSLLKSWLMYVLRMGKSWITGNFKKIKLANVGLKDFLSGPECLMKDLNTNNERIRNIVQNTKINLLNILSFPFIVFVNSIKLLSKFEKVKQRYKDSYKYLISEEYWLKQFNN